MTHQQQISFSSTGHGHMHDLTEQVTSIAAASGIRTGLIHVFTIGSTAAVGTIEFEPGLKRDLPEILDKLIPPSRHYGHEQAWHDGNGHSHLQATLLGPSLTVPLADSKPVLETWQQIFWRECESARDRGRGGHGRGRRMQCWQECISAKGKTGTQVVIYNDCRIGSVQQLGIDRTSNCAAEIKRDSAATHVIHEGTSFH